jgi:hypothetical protein
VSGKSEVKFFHLEFHFVLKIKRKCDLELFGQQKFDLFKLCFDILDLSNHILQSRKSCIFAVASDAARAASESLRLSFQEINDRQYESIN